MEETKDFYTLQGFFCFGLGFSGWFFFLFGFGLGFLGGWVEPLFEIEISAKKDKEQMVNWTLKKIAKSRCYAACCSRTMQGCNSGITSKGV